MGLKEVEKGKLGKVVRKRERGSGRGVDDVRLGVGLGSLSLGGNFTTDDEFSDVVSLGQVEESPDFGGTLLSHESKREEKVSFLMLLIQNPSFLFTLPIPLHPKQSKELKNEPWDPTSWVEPDPSIQECRSLPA